MKLPTGLRTFFATRRPRVWWSAGIVFSCLLFVYVAVPIIAASRIDRERIAFELSAWSGYRVTIEQDPEIRLFPLRAILTDMKLSDWKGEGPPVLSAERTTVDLEAFPGLIGDVYIWRVRLQSPVLRVERDANGIYLPRLPGGGRMANAVKDAQVITATNPSNPDFSSMAGDPFGVVKFTDGRIIDEDGAGIVSNCEGIVSWPSLEKPGSLRATGVWRGETVNVELSSNEPMMLLTGGTGQARFSFSGAPGNATFEGKVNLSSKPFIDGEGTFSTSSLRRMLEWSRAYSGPHPGINTVSATGHLQGGEDRIKLDDLALSVDGSAGTGGVEIDLHAPRPVISGTLAFQKVDMTSFLSLLTSTGADGLPRISEVDSDFSQTLDLDLRMSAVQANAGAVLLSDVAATAQVRDGLAVFDLSDARAFDGTVQAGLRMDRKGDATQVEASLRATNIDGLLLAQEAGLSDIIPSGRASIAFDLKGPVEHWETYSDKLNGTLDVKFGPGTLNGFDMQAFLAKTREGDFFPLKSVSKGSLPIEKLTIAGDITGNLFRLASAEIVSSAGLISLSGLVSYSGEGLALTGAVRDAAGNAGGPGFFVGGTWSEPFISPGAPAPHSE